MCSGSGPSAPAPLPPPPEQQDAGVTSARDAERMRKRQAASQTILTTPRGVTTSANAPVKTLLGQ